MVIRICEATGSDIPDLSKLMLQLGESTGSPQRNDIERLERMIASNDDGVLKVLSNQVIVGVCVFSVHFSAWHGGKIGYIHSMVVDSEYRNQETGGKLLAELVDLVKGAGIIGLELDSGFAREKAHKFYETQWFKKVSYLFSRRI